jgi:membrane protease YdiL (CAAX protease family)
MDELPADPWLAGFVGILWLASVAAWIGLFARWRRRGAILDYEPRSPVPWGAPIAILAAVFVAVSIASSLVAEPPQDPPPDQSEVFQRLLGFIVFQSVLTGGVLFVVAVLYRTRRRDFGLPASANEFVRDVGIGIVAWLAAIVPVHSLQMLLLHLSGLKEEPPSHPLIKMITSGEPNVTLLLLASFVAVVVAPLSEEILFRLLLQGWLEKWEDKRLGWRRTSLPILRISEQDLAEYMLQRTDEATLIDQPAMLAPPPQGVAGLPYGWAPILVSSLLFAVAHYGHGPDPVALFFLAIILGYVYQRTHRIVACIVTHALFNALAMLVLWYMVFFNAQ